MLKNRFFKRLNQEKDPLRFLWSRLLWHSGASTWFEIQRNNYKLHFFPTALSATLYYDPNFGLEEEFILKNLLKSGDTFVDIGANIGHLSLFASTLVGSTGKVFSFEPHPKIFAYLMKNIEINKVQNVQAFNYGLGENEGSFTFSNSRSDDQNYIEQNAQTGVTVQVKTLDNCFPDIKINLLKVDTEGFEKFVFLGGQKVLQNTEHIYFETLEKNCQRFNYSVKDLLEFLADFHFEFFAFRDSQWVPFLKDHSPYPNNLLAKKKARA